MIELGQIKIKDDISVVEAGNKIRILAQDLKFDSIGATRLATITSEISRAAYKKGKAANSLICLIITGYLMHAGLFTKRLRAGVPAHRGQSGLRTFQNRQERILDILKTRLALKCRLSPLERKGTRLSC